MLETLASFFLLPVVAVLHVALSVGAVVAIALPIAGVCAGVQWLRHRFTSPAK